MNNHQPGPTQTTQPDIPELPPGMIIDADDDAAVAEAAAVDANSDNAYDSDYQPSNSRSSEEWVSAPKRALRSTPLDNCRELLASPPEAQFFPDERFEGVVTAVTSNYGDNALKLCLDELAENFAKANLEDVPLFLAVDRWSWPNKNLRPEHSHVLTQMSNSAGIQNVRLPAQLRFRYCRMLNENGCIEAAITNLTKGLRTKSIVNVKLNLNK